MKECCDEGKPNVPTKTGASKRELASNRADNSRRFRIGGMDCAEEVRTLKRELGPLVGGEEKLSFDVLNGSLAITSAPGEVTDEDIVRAVARTGMTAKPWRAKADTQVDTAGEHRRHAWLTAGSGVFAILAFTIHAVTSGGVSGAIGSEGMGAAHVVPVGVRLLYLLSIVLGLVTVLPKAWYAARNIRPDMNLLMTVAVAGALGIGEWFEGATVAFLFALSLSLEAWSVGRARRAIAVLMDLSPTSVLVKDAQGSERQVPPGEVVVGAIFIVKPGGKLALDGRIVRGESSVNQAPVTGESVPVPKRLGDEVYAGSINGDGALEIESTKPASDTTLARIIRMVDEAQSQRAPSEQWVEKFARVYTPIVMALAACVLLGPPFLLGAAWSEWFYRALVLLVIACPCALVISTPVSIVAALAAAARRGVLVKGGAYIEAPGRLKAIAFDKTGTLTKGKPEVVEVVPMSGHDETELLSISASLEARADHPLARAIVDFAHTRGIDARPADDLKIIQGKGATGGIAGRQYWLGSHRYLEERGQETPGVHEKLESLTGSGRTVVVIGGESHVCGFIALADIIRPEAMASIRRLRANGIEHLVMLTGDNAGTARAIAEQAGITEVRAELLPQHKVDAVENLVARYGAVAMVGDGVNDAPAMARAGLGIAMGAAGSDAAIETADIALMSDDLSKVPWLVEHSRRTLAVIRQNIALSLVVKLAFVGLTFAGKTSLWAAIAADMGTSLVVVFNGLRLLRPSDLASDAA